VRHGALSSFADVLGAALRAGLPVREALPLAAQASASHPGFDGAGAGLVEQVDKGATLTEALSTLRVFPAPFLAQVGAGEAAGRLDETLEVLRKDHQERSRLAWLFVVVVIGVVAMLGIAALTAIKVVSGFASSFDTMNRAIDQVAPQ